MSDATTWLLGMGVIFAGAAAVGGLLDLLGWLSDRRHIQWWDRHRNEIEDLPSPWPLSPGWDAPGDAGHVSLLPGFPAGSFPGVPRTNVLARTPGKGSGQNQP